MLDDAPASMATAMLHLFAGQPRPTWPERPVSLVKCILTLLAVATLIVAAPSGTEAWISCSQQQPSPTSSGTPAAHVSVPDYVPGLDLHLHQLTFLLGAPPCTACTTPDATTPARYPNPVTSIVSTSTQTCTFNDHGSFKTASHKETGLNGSRLSLSTEGSAPGGRLSMAPSFAGMPSASSSRNVRRALPHNLLGPGDHNSVTTTVSTSTQTCTFNDHGSFKTASHKKTGLNGSRRCLSPERSAPGERLSSAPSFAGPVRALSSQNVRRALPHNLLGPDDWDQGDGY